MKLYALKYNNYYNRILKIEDSLNDYLVSPYYNNLSIDNVSFNPNDGIDTTQIVNFVPEADYVLITIKVNNVEVIYSRWFILEAKRTRTGQYNLTLKRDVLADNYLAFMESTSLIEKGFVDSNNPLIYNNEDVLVNQIKKEEILLKDKSNVQWIVGYIAKNASETDIPIDYDRGPAIPIGTTLENWKWNKESYIAYPTGVQLEWDYQEPDVSGIPMRPKYTVLNKDGSFNKTGYSDSISPILINYPFNLSILQANYLNLGGEAQVVSLLNSYAGTSTVANDEAELLSYAGSTIVDTNGNYYEVRVTPINDLAIYNQWISTTDTSGLVTFFRNCLNNLTTHTSTNRSYRISLRAHRYNISIFPSTSISGYKVSIPATRTHTQDALYDVFAIPCGNITVGSVTMNEDLAKATANAIGIKLSATNNTVLYDLQFLPYCPIQGALTELGAIDLTRLSANDYNIIYNGSNQPAGYVFNILKSEFTFNIDNPISVRNYLDDNTAFGKAINTKISNECDVYRLCSPNYSGIFEFSVAKNGGVTSFNVDCTYKPYQPYIHVNPQFSGLYGADFNDSRGLILGGDFSYGQISDKWQEYQINNKNFQEIFDRDIKHMDITKDISVTKQVISGVTSAGASAFNGKYASAVSGAINTANNIGATIATWAEQKDYASDMYKYKMGNIQALPYSLARASAITYNYKKWPFVEFYTCTDEEKEAIKNQMLYDGMSINKIGVPASYIYEGRRIKLKGQLIRIDIDNESYRNVAIISEEFKKGFYVGEDTESEERISYSITNELSNVTATATNPTTIKSNESKVLTFTADTGYNLPDSIQVYGASYTWNKTTGTLTIFDAYQNVNIKIIGLNADTYAIYTALFNVTGNASNPNTITAGGTATLLFTANSGYSLPNSVSVVGATYTWDKTTGTLILSNATGDININIYGVANTYYTLTVYSEEVDSGVFEVRTFQILAGSTVNPSSYIKTYTDYEYQSIEPTESFVMIGNSSITVYYNYQGSATHTLTVIYDYYGTELRRRTFTINHGEYVDPLDYCPDLITIGYTNYILDSTSPSSEFEMTSDRTITGEYSTE